MSRLAVFVYYRVHGEVLHFAQSITEASIIPNDHQKGHFSLATTIVYHFCLPQYSQTCKYSKYNSKGWPLEHAFHMLTSTQTHTPPGPCRRMPLSLHCPLTAGLTDLQLPSSYGCTSLMCPLKAMDECLKCTCPVMYIKKGNALFWMAYAASEQM